MMLYDIVSRLSDVRLNQINRDPVWADTAGKDLAWPDVQMNREALLAVRQRLSPYASGALETVVRRYGPKPFDEERLLRAAQSGHWSGAELRQGLNELRQSGIIFTTRKTWGDRLHFLPRDTFPLWLNVFCPLQMSPLDLNRFKLSHRTGNDKQPLSMSLFRVLSTLYRCNEDWTSRGVLPKKLIAKLCNQMNAGERILETMGTLFAFKDDYPAELALILDMAVAMNWLKETECRYEWNLDELTDWLRLCAEQREALLIGSFIYRYALADEAAAHAAAAMLFMKEDVWYPVSGVLSWLDRCFEDENSKTDPAEKPRRVRCESLLRVFTSFGWIEQAMTPDGEAVFRWLLPPAWDAERRPDEPEEPLRIQPGGEIIVTREVRLQTRWMLEQLAELQSEDRIAVYRLRPESVARALSNGWTTGGIIRFLEEGQGGPLPGEIIAAITDWTAHAGKVLVEEVTILRCDSDAAAERLAVEPSVAPLLERIGPRCFIVEAGRAAEVGRRLERIGLAPRQESAKRSKTGSDSSRKRKGKLKEAAISKGLYYDPLSLDHYELLTEPEGETELYPGLEQVPISWTRQFRTYHASTRKEIIERALTWQTPVELRKDSETVSFVPLRLEEEHEGWAVMGRLRTNRSGAPVHIRLTPDMWGEMKLLLPGQAGE
ncbi:helicase-associated domain-containing protein [Paenibacillus tarimensis]